MVETTPVTISLTRLLNKIQDKSVLLKNCPVPNFNILSHHLLNPYPDWVSKSKSWAIFGTFSDYVIRKILFNLFPKKIRLNYMIAANARRILRNAIYNIQAFVQTPLTKQLLQNYNTQELFAFFNATESYIRNYLDNSINWKDSLYEIFQFSHLDKLRRENKLILPQTSKTLILKCIPFFEHIEHWLEYKFTESEGMYLNPTLGHEQTLNADADLVINSTLYEIKTVLYPDKYIKEDFHQLYGYVALFEYLKEHEQIQNYKILERSKIDSIGFIFPLFLQEIRMDISSWKIKNRLKYLKKLLSFK